MTRPIVFAFCTLFLVQGVGAWDVLNAQDGPPVTIKVITVTKDGTPIRARVRIKPYPNPEEDAYVVQVDKQFKIIQVGKCDESVWIGVRPETIGIVRKIGNWLPCRQPELKFDDFEIVPLALKKPSAPRPGKG